MKELCKAMSEAFPDIMGAIKDKTNPHFRSKYADLGNVIDAIKPALVQHGLWFIQTVHNVPGCAAVETIIMHSSGESLSCGVVSIPVNKLDAQGFGSALTYARRYSLSAAFGVAPEDDDGNEACKQTARMREKEITEVPDSRSCEVRKSQTLSPEQLTALAEEVSIALCADQELDSEYVVKSEVESFLTMWQTKAPLHPMVDNLLSKDRKKLLDGYLRWKNQEQKS